MSLDFMLVGETGKSIDSFNITHNLTKMADEAGIYQVLWRPDEIGFERASQIIEPLRAGLTDMKARPEHFRQFDAPNGWGKYKDFVPFVEKVLAACENCPWAKIEVSR